ncbi:phosphate/phosphite/phosphonate ABC transporter substrate-binding protein [Aquincola sp. S2]|uniref:Phosphate/phosphite/phosphonate ABC transporter substrate-binding protein n=1 Tax=Pseudaquabacterium terrae TaxID=2732868 RepID=A0ABX2EP25_9BURK|nr:phosphate/phosphite/phosphonate ABC transporter substrate-binding protein [Aquabacterium terrae]NRF70429.1 phosphate/phosphite/phosphonate ABC transporter substrate-binding protein [Aquabacterium terrae]
MTPQRRAALALLAAAALAPRVPRAQPAAPDALTFGLITPREPDKVLAAWNPFLQALSRHLGRAIKPWIANRPQEVIDGLRAGRLDLAWVGNTTALEIVENGSGEVFAQMLTGDGRTGYRSILVTHKDSGIESLDHAQQPERRLIFGDGDPKSTSGHLVPLYYAFVKRGINDPRTLYREVRHGSHRANLRMAALREVDIATANDVELHFFTAEQPALGRALRVIWHSPDIPHSPLVWRLALPAPLRQRIQQAVVEFGQRDAAERAILRGVNDLSGFRKSRNRQLITVADIEMFAAWQRVNNDAALAPADKLARIADISQRASRLELRLKQEPSLR